MSEQEESYLDKIAEKLIAGAETISKGRLGSELISKISCSLETEVVGAHPQTNTSGPNGAFVDDGYLYLDRFPEPASDPIRLHLEKGARWTDVLSCTCTPIGLCFLVNAKALEVFKRFELDKVRYYRASVKKNWREKRDYTFVFLCNHLTLDDIDFSRSECYLVDMISQPIKEIEVSDRADYLKKDNLAKEGALPDSEQFSRIDLGKMQLLPSHKPKADLFGMGRYLGTKSYISKTFQAALVESNISGLEFEPNTRIFL